MNRAYLSPSKFIGQGAPLALIGGPCSIESIELCLTTAHRVKEICSRLGITYIFKSSFDKANRTSITSFRGPNIDEGLQILQRVKSEIEVPITTDIHESWQAKPVASVVDILQIPAYLCRQTDLLLAAATGKAVNVKKAQFLAPWDLKQVAAKLEYGGARNILLTERGSCFGYNTIIVDFRSLPQMRALGYPVVFDATHSVQMPGSKGTCSGGQREFVPHLARAAAAVGIDALFMEIHPNPDEALSDGPNMVRVDELEKILEPIVQIHKQTNSFALL